MEQFDQNLLRKYRQNECSPEEYAKVLEWFTSEEGREYLETAMSQDLERGTYSPVESAALYQRILDSTQPRKNRFTALKAAAVLTGTLLLGYGGWKLFSKGDTVVHTAYGEIRTIVLPDQSVVTLNANSTLRYKNREVWMEGEAYFSVKPSATSQPFLVHTASKINVEVLGTTFNLVDRHGKMQIVLTSGKVRLHNNKEATIMKPGDLVEYKKQVRTTLKQHTDTLNYSSWKNNSLHFENASFAELSQLLEDTYGVKVEIRDSSLLHQQFTGTVPGQQIDILLNGLSQLFHLKVTNENNRVIIEKDNKY
jgi:ferric-dicitrate binding protein FerR (iron transport regulator)